MSHAATRKPWFAKLAVFFMLTWMMGIVHANESFLRGIYKDVSGNAYLVSGPALSSDGRSQWTIASTKPVSGTNVFNAIWETGPAVGNSYLAGTNLVTNYPNGYLTGRSYGVMASENWGYWYSGDRLAVSQVGSSLVVSKLNDDGVVNRSTTFTYVSDSNIASGSSETYLSGTYTDPYGNSYSVTGPSVGANGRAQGAIASIGSGNMFNAIWETGAAVGNSYLAGTSLIKTYPNGYLIGRSYGVMASVDWGYWYSGDRIAVSQVGSSLVISKLNSDGVVNRAELFTGSSLSLPQPIMNLNLGWNLVGNGAGGGIAVGSLLNDTSSISTVWKWNAEKKNWAFYSPLLADGGAAYAAGKGYDFLTVINPGEGFWVNAKQAKTVVLPGGMPVASTFFQGLPTGWNLISMGNNRTPSVFNTDLSVSPMEAGVIPANITSLWTWDSGVSNWYFYSSVLESKGGTVLSDYVASKNYLNFGAKTLDSTTGLWVNIP